MKRWKLSPVDLASLDKWDDYTAAEDVMFRHTHLPHSPWKVINGNDKRRARLEAMRCVLPLFGYSGRRDEVVGAADPLIVGLPAPDGLKVASRRAPDGASAGRRPRGSGPAAV